MAAPERLFRWYTGRCRSPRTAAALLLGAALLAALAVFPVAQLELRSDLTELLPDGHPAVVALRRVAPRQISATNVVLLIASPDPAANRRFAEALRPALAAL